MKFFAILLCIAIDSVFGELQRPGFEKEKLEVTEDVNETRSLISLDDRRKPYSSDESVRVKYALDSSLDHIAVNTKDADSVEKETSRNPSPVIETSTVKPTSYRAIKKNLEIMYIRKPARKEANLVSNSRRFLRRKRMAEVEDPTNPVESYKMHKKVREKLPEQLKMKMRKTDAAEEKLLTSYATSSGDTSNLIADYNSAKSAEREQLKVVASGSGATEVIDNYKALRKGKPWNYIKLRVKFKRFFGKPSPSLTEYETLKQDEVASIDSLLGGSSNTESEKAKTVEPQEKEKPAAEKATNAQTQEKEKPAEEKATNVQPQEKEKPTEEKATNVQPQEKETPSDEKDWLSTEPVVSDPVTGGHSHYAFKPDSMLFDASIDVDSKIDDTNETNWLKNMMRYDNFHGYFDKGLRHPMENTDGSEIYLLKYSAEAGKLRKGYLDLYYKYRKKEIEALKEYLASRPEKVRERVLLVYKAIRKGKPWYWMYVDYPISKFFDGHMPKPAMDKYLAVKKEELYTDQYLDGSMKIGEVSKTAENTKAVASEKPSSQNEKPKEDETKKATEGEKPNEEKNDNPKQEETKKATESEKPKEEETKQVTDEGTSEEDKRLLDKAVDDSVNRDWSCMRSLTLYETVCAFLSKGMQAVVKETDEADKNLITKAKETGKIDQNSLDTYYACRKKEIETLKAYLAKHSKKLQERILLAYKDIRRGIPLRNWIKENVYKDFFQGRTKSVSEEYEAIRKQELYTDQYLDGSMKIGDKAPAKDENMKVEIIQLASSQIERGKANRKLKAQVADLARAEEDEKAEEMERGVRAKETETVEVEYDAYRENAENIVATSDDAKEDVEGHGSPDNVTSADATNTETTTHTKTKDNSHLLRFAILLAMVSQVIIAILILAPQRDKLVEWCTRKKRTEFGPSETEPLQVGEKVFATGPTSKVLKVSSQRRPDVADANQ